MEGSVFVHLPARGVWRAWRVAGSEGEVGGDVVALLLHTSGERSRL